MKLPILLALAGVAVVGLLLSWVDAGAVWAVVRQAGWGGFGLLMAWQGLLFVVLGLAWAVVVPGVRPGVLVWGRMVRDAATTCLPFSPVGGFVIGARAVGLRGVAWPSAAAGTVVDVTAEIVAQLLFTLGGVAVLVLVRPGSSAAGPVGVGAGMALGLLLAALWQRRAVGRGLRALGGKLLGDWFKGAAGGLERLEAELARLFVPGRVAAGTALHLVGWLGTGVGTWIALGLLGVQVPLLWVLAMEALIDALVGAAFVVPGAAGVQEAGYVGLGAAFGVPAEVALGVALLRRGKDLAWGLPILAAWQWMEWRRRA